MNSLAIELNNIISSNAPEIYDILSTFGREIFFPKGILTQTAEAKERAYKFDATIGIALDHGNSIYLPSIHKFFTGLDIKDIYPYAPAAGKPELRRTWKKHIINNTPSLSAKVISDPIATCGITHGLSIIGDLFIDKDDIILLPNKFWGNYRLIFDTRYGANIKTYELFNSSGGFNLTGFSDALKSIQGSKVLTILNFPNNPTGYTPTIKEAQAIRNILVDYAEHGNKITVVTDDAYLGFFYEDVLKESIFGYVANSHKNLFSIKLDGATKEEYAWGFRVGFITFAFGDRSIENVVYEALEKKVMGAIRSKVSNVPHLSQTLVLKALESKTYDVEKRERHEIMRNRAIKIKDVLANPKYTSVWMVYPFNSGYFMCLHINTVNAESLRVHLLDNYGIGTVSTGDKDLRIAFSAIDEESIPQLYESIYLSIKELERG